MATFTSIQNGHRYERTHKSRGLEKDQNEKRRLATYPFATAWSSRRIHHPKPLTKRSPDHQQLAKIWRLQPLVLALHQLAGETQPGRNRSPSCVKSHSPAALLHPLFHTRTFDRPLPPTDSLGRNQKSPNARDRGAQTASYKSSAPICISKHRMRIAKYHSCMWQNVVHFRTLLNRKIAVKFPILVTARVKLDKLRTRICSPHVRADGYRLICFIRI